MHTISQVREALKQIAARGRHVGFVPTMGALHAGHQSLFEAARFRGDAVLCSIFINPTQFDDPADLAAYPTSLEADLKLLETTGCDIAFVPVVTEVYPADQVIPTYDFGTLERQLEGAVRPGHFKGMAQVVGRLLEIVQPDRLYMGQKDYQQYLIVKQLVSEKLQLETEVVLCPIVREPDGLAMSSRNVRLSPSQRKDAVILSQVLFWIRDKLDIMPIDDLVSTACERLLATPSITSIDYVCIADAQSLAPVAATGSSHLVALAAIRMDAVRLIDNVLLSQS